MEGGGGKMRTELELEIAAIGRAGDAPLYGARLSPAQMERDWEEGRRVRPEDTHHTRSLSPLDALVSFLQALEAEGRL
jgi:hypothetical protein